MNKWLELFKNDDYIGIKQYLKSGADIQATNEIGEGVLSCALRAKCDFDTLMLLIDNGAEIFAFDNEGVSVFDIAITYNSIEMVRYLINQGIDINKTTRRSGFSALMAAVCYGRVELVELLLLHGAHPEHMDSKGFKAVDFANKMNKKSMLKILESYAK